ncbi:hypothetical protein [Butyrivibrio sp. MC2013]|uniref:hypothetical protein n=1 Tax=Butyrivibrio sp. MC2013 TaxID=1280686 RepID=UPI00047BB8E1|nr:hypothetical protein [Butyrivibrio sp. MC2013]
MDYGAAEAIFFVRCTPNDILQNSSAAFFPMRRTRKNSGLSARSDSFLVGALKAAYEEFVKFIFLDKDSKNISHLK